MPNYLFQAPGGDVKSVYFPMSKAPHLGDKVILDGIPCVRVLGDIQVRTPATRSVVSHSLPRWHEDAPHHDKDGRPCFGSQREVDEFCSKTRDTDPHGGYEYGVE